MKTILALGLAGLLGLLVFTSISANVPFASTVSGSSQIYIHGTPVCVTQQGKDIVARVGECAMAALPPETDSLERLPFHGRPGMELPPGHPPIDREMFPDENRRVLI